MNIFRELHRRSLLGKETHKEVIIKMNHSEHDVRMLIGKNWPRIRKSGRLFTVIAEAFKFFKELTLY
jgi:hypothetical protein